jgi:hypothetical protein
LAQEAIEASDEDLREAASDLGMDLTSKGSSAFAGLTHFARPQLSEFFDVEVSRSLQAPGRRPGSPLAQLNRKQRRFKASWAICVVTPNRKKRPLVRSGLGFGLIRNLPAI